MSQHSEERLPETEGAPSVHSGARILPFERPQSELQRAIQQRAQEDIDLNRERDRETRRPQPLKWLTIFALACIPVLLTLLVIDGFVRVFHKVTEMYSSEPAQQQSAPAATESETEPQQSRPGIVMLESYDVQKDAQRSAPAGADAPAPAPNPPQQR